MAVPKNLRCKRCGVVKNPADFYSGKIANCNWAVAHGGCPHQEVEAALAG